MRIDIVTPSRSQPRQSAYLERMILSVARQRSRQAIEFRILIGLDPGAAEPELDGAMTLGKVRFARAEVASQAALDGMDRVKADMDVACQYHLDHDWPGRARELGLRRVHVTETIRAPLGRIVAGFSADSCHHREARQVHWFRSTSRCRLSAASSTTIRG